MSEAGTSVEVSAERPWPDAPAWVADLHADLISRIMPETRDEMTMDEAEQFGRDLFELIALKAALIQSTPAETEMGGALLALAPPPPGLPPAYNGCTCSCHRTPGIIHMVACCHPGKPMDRDWFERRARMEGTSEIGVGSPTSPPIGDGGGDLVRKMRAASAQLREVTNGFTPWLDAGDAKRLIPVLDEGATAIEALRAERDAATADLEATRAMYENLEASEVLNGYKNRAESLSRQLEEAREAAFEECAKIADDRTPTKHDGTLAAHVTGTTIAAAIRARAKEAVSHE